MIGSTPNHRSMEIKVGQVWEHLSPHSSTSPKTEILKIVSIQKIDNSIYFDNGQWSTPEDMLITFKEYWTLLSESEPKKSRWQIIMEEIDAIRNQNISG
jgi:hypothetical protein